MPVSITPMPTYSVEITLFLVVLALCTTSAYLWGLEEGLHELQFAIFPQPAQLARPETFSP